MNIRTTSPGDWNTSKVESITQVHWRYRRITKISLVDISEVGLLMVFHDSSSLPNRRARHSVFRYSGRLYRSFTSRMGHHTLGRVLASVLRVKLKTGTVAREPWCRESGPASGFRPCTRAGLSWCADAPCFSVTVSLLRQGWNSSGSKATVIKVPRTRDVT